MSKISRRNTLALGASAILMEAIPYRFAFADQSEPTFEDVLAEGIDQGLLSTNVNPGGLMNDMQKELLLAELVVASIEKDGTGTAGSLAFDSGKVLSKLNQQAKLVNKKRSPPTFESLKSGYRHQFDTCAITAGRAAEIKKWVAFFSGQRNRRQYDTVEKHTGVPWYFVATLHLREASANFMGHLHNGDPLQALTVQVPKGLPPRPWPPTPWDPTTAWIKSARNALEIIGFNGLASKSWTLERMLYRFEKYNGFGYYYHKTPSSYLWNFSSVGKKGGYASDGKWSDHYVSRQIGAAVLIKQMVIDGIITVPYET